MPHSSSLSAAPAVHFPTARASTARRFPTAPPRLLPRGTIRDYAWHYREIYGELSVSHGSCVSTLVWTDVSAQRGQRQASAASFRFTLG